MCAMSTERVISALNFLITGEGVNHYPDDCDGNTIEALMSDCFNEAPRAMTKAKKEISHLNEKLVFYRLLLQQPQE